MPGRGRYSIVASAGDNVAIAVAWLAQMVEPIDHALCFLQNCRRAFRLLAAAGTHVDAAPPRAIIGIAAQSVRLVNTVLGAVRIGGVYKHRRQLIRGELARLFQRHDRKVLTLRLASGCGASQHGAKRDPQTRRRRNSRRRRCGRGPLNQSALVSVGFDSVVDHVQARSILIAPAKGGPRPATGGFAARGKRARHEGVNDMPNRVPLDSRKHPRA
jgi:hypothetical protein